MFRLGCRRRLSFLCYRKRFLQGVVLFFVLFAQVIQASPLDGQWQHPEDPVWIEINVEDGRGVAVRNDDQPDTVGFSVVRDLMMSDESGVWQGQVFVPQLDRYKAVRVTLPDEQTLRMTVKFGFLRRSVDWSRADSDAGVRRD